MTVEIVAEKEASDHTFPALILNSETMTLVLAMGTGVDGDFSGVCLADALQVHHLGEYGSWSSRDFSFYKGDVVLHG